MSGQKVDVDGRRVVDRRDPARMVTRVPNKNYLWSALLAVFVPLFPVLIFTGSCLAIEVHKLDVSPYKVKGDRAELRCIYDLGEDRLYTVKWYKDDREFFRVILSDTRNDRHHRMRAPQFAEFPMVGVRLDKDASGEKMVVLKKVNRESSGTYKCEVIGEAPGFHTGVGEAEMRVVELPHPPRLEGLKSGYTVGDILDINCTSSHSNPAASLQWYINGKQAPAKFTKDYPPMTEPLTGLETSVLGLSFRLATHDKFERDQPRSYATVVRCTAEIEKVYFKHVEKEIEVMPDTWTASSKNTKTRSSPGNGAQLSSSGCVIAMALLVTMLVVAERL